MLFKKTDKNKNKTKYTYFMYLQIFSTVTVLLYSQQDVARMSIEIYTANAYIYFK